MWVNLWLCHRPAGDRGQVSASLGAPVLAHGCAEGEELCDPTFESQLLGTMATQLQALAHGLAHSRHSGSNTFRKDEELAVPSVTEVSSELSNGVKIVLGLRDPGGSPCVEV